MPNRPLKRVLFVESDPDHRFVLECILEQHPEIGHRILHGFAAVRPAIEHFAPELVCLSHGRREHDAIPTVLEMRTWEIGRTPAVALMTPLMSAEDIEEYEAVDIDGLIEKPFEPGDFVRQMRRIYREWRRRQPTVRKAR